MGHFSSQRVRRPPVNRTLGRPPKNAPTNVVDDECRIAYAVPGVQIKRCSCNPRPVGTPRSGLGDKNSGEIRMTTKTRKDSYTVPCSSQFRDAINQLAERRRVNVGDLARSILLTVPEDKIRSVPDPGGPPPGDREETVLKSGPSEGRPWRRKPRLQVRLASGYDTSMVRRALNLALSLDREDLRLDLIDPADAAADDAAGAPEITEELERLKAIVSVLAFDPLKDGVQSRSDALHVLGFAPGARPDRSAVRNRFRMLATNHHPDSNYGNHQRMSQLNAAMEILNG